ncbi:MAG: alcohol dehydrogenase catalytic domain-containing protein [Deltaproteobacteria bacterium]|nr:alcohol dehydrogenase catalytic domain-containing protein [Deltaproteobacteria bacterium]
MLAVIKTNPIPKEMSVKNVEKPKLKTGHAIVKVDAVGICGTDVHIYNWEIGYQKRLEERLPVTLGHEFTGIIEEMDGISEEIAVGDRVVAIPAVGCGTCYYCRNGSREICLNRKPIGLEYPGAMAEYVLVDKNQCFVLPKDFPVTLGAAIEPMSVAYNAVFKAGSLLGKNVVVIGPGAIGYYASMFAYLAGAADISISGLPQDASRLIIFKNNIPGINIFTDTKALLHHTSEISNGVGVDVILEISGSGGGLSSAISLAKKRAIIVLVGIASKPLTIDSIALVRNEIRMSGTHVLPPKLWGELINLLISLDDVDKARFEESITHKFPISEAEKAFKIVEDCLGMKVLIHP